jgi:hypothetical protein
MTQLLVNELPPASTATAAHLRTWSAQAALFVRWALDGERAPRRAAFWKLVDRACNEPVTEECFRDCFGFGYADARDRLSDYLPSAVRNPIRLRAEKLTRLPSVRMRDATRTEIGRLKGEWERLEIGFVRARHPEFTGKYQEQAHRTLTQAFEAAPQDPRLLTVIGLYEIDVGNETQARPYLEAAAKARIVRPRLYFELSRLRYAEARANAAGRDGLLSVAQANSVLDPLNFGHTQTPPLVENYLLVAEVWSRAEAALERRHFALLEEGLRLFPQNPRLLYGVAALNALQGRRTEATALVERGLRIVQSGPAREAFLKLQAALANATPPRAAEAQPAAVGK